MWKENLIDTEVHLAERSSQAVLQQNQLNAVFCERKEAHPLGRTSVFNIPHIYEQYPSNHIGTLNNDSELIKPIKPNILSPRIHFFKNVHALTIRSGGKLNWTQ